MCFIGYLVGEHAEKEPDDEDDPLIGMDAVAGGAEPILPNRLAYPNFFAPKFLYDCSLSSPSVSYADEMHGCAKHIELGVERWLRGDTRRCDLSYLSSTILASEYESILTQLRG